MTTAMNDLELLGALHSRGMTILREAAAVCGAAATAAHVPLMALGLPRGLALQIVKLAAVYFGPTKYTRRQPQAVAAATRSGHSVGQLQLIETYVGKLDDAGQAWNLRLALCRFEGNDAGLRREAERLVESYNGPKCDAPQAPVAGFKRVPGTTQRRMFFDDTEHEQASREKQARAYADAHGVSLGEAVKALFFSGEASGDVPAVPDPETIVVLTLEEAEKLLGEAGDEIYVGGSDGVRRPGRDIVEKLLAGSSFSALLVHPEHGPVNMYRVERFANRKQRRMAKAAALVCEWPGCSTPADECQVNHNEPWSEGGQSNAANFSMLCRFHNGWANDARNGQIVRIRGQNYRVPPPGGGPPHQNQHPVAKRGAMRISASV